MWQASRFQKILLGAGLALFAVGLALSQEKTSGVDELSALALGLAVVLTAAKLAGDLFTRIGQPSVLGELLAGVLLGNLPGLGMMHEIGADPYLGVLARLGMLLLLFETGLELRVVELFAVGGSSLLVALIGTIVSFALGWSVSVWLLPGAPAAVPLFLGAAITATSVGITARVLKDIGASRSKEAKVILGAAVIDDVLALLVLALVTGWVASRQSGTGLPWQSLVALMAKTLGFLTVAIVLGAKLTPIWFRHAASLRTEGALLAVGLCFCFVLSWAASAIGMAPLIGAFAAGLVLEEAHSASFVQRGERSLRELLEPITSFLVPVFFVLVGISQRGRFLAGLPGDAETRPHRPHRPSAPPPSRCLTTALLPTSRS